MHTTNWRILLCVCTLTLQVKTNTCILFHIFYNIPEASLPGPQKLIGNIDFQNAHTMIFPKMHRSNPHIILTQIHNRPDYNWLLQVFRKRFGSYLKNGWADQ